MIARVGGCHAKTTPSMITWLVGPKFFSFLNVEILSTVRVAERMIVVGKKGFVLCCIMSLD
jgi:hypothetical protein